MMSIQYWRIRLLNIYLHRCDFISIFFLQQFFIRIHVCAQVIESHKNGLDTFIDFIGSPFDYSAFELSMCVYVL